MGHIVQEIEYWGINEFFLDTCCSYRYHDRKLERGRHRSWDDESDVSSVDTSVDEISDLNKSDILALFAIYVNFESGSEDPLNCYHPPSSQGHAAFSGGSLWEHQKVFVAYTGEPRVLHPQQALQSSLHRSGAHIHRHYVH
ncbi:hypothetical protein XENOCAPTIV_014410 [Xenoophorus captivus]|uniref:Uncharacterized protein n=1 Tax=Xenoophorus captivus TaxID=1517983 RepID=A0ABV0Q9Y8_9TELE